LDLANGFSVAPHQNTVDMPVAALKRALIHVIDRFAQNQRAAGERTVHKSLPADVDGLVLKGDAFKFREEHSAAFLVGGMVAKSRRCVKRKQATSRACVAPCCGGEWGCGYTQDYQVVDLGRPCFDRCRRSCRLLR